MRTFAFIGSFSLIFILWSYWESHFRYNKRSAGEPMHTPVVIKGDSLFYDTLSLSLKTVPKVREIYAVSKSVLDTWAHLFVVLKIEESGSDGHLSKYGRLYNNLVGMRVPKGRSTTCIGRSPTGYAVFRHWWDSVLDFKFFLDNHLAHFQQRKGRAPRSEAEFVNYIFNSYNGHSAWLEDVHWLLKHVNFEANSKF